MGSADPSAAPYDGVMRALITGLLLFTSIGAAHADDARASAKAFLDGIYAHYLGKESKGVPLSTKGDLERLFAPKLARAILADRARAAARGEVPVLDGDPFIDAQDWEIAAFDITVDLKDANHAVGTVRFTNLEQQPSSMSISSSKKPAGASPRSARRAARSPRCSSPTADIDEAARPGPLAARVRPQGADLCVADGRGGVLSCSTTEDWLAS